MKSILLNDLAKMSPDEQKRILTELIAEAKKPPNPNMIQDLKNLILEYEQRYGMTSNIMRDKIANGEIVESDDHCAWLMHLKLLERLEYGED